MRVTASTLCLLATLSSSFPKGISAKEICNSFSGADASNDAVKWCSSLDRTTKCCTNNEGDVSSTACGDWGSNAEYNLCEGSCQGTNSCLSMLTNATAGSTISIKEGGCVSDSSRRSKGVCERFAKNADGVVTASIGIDACSGGDEACINFLESASGNITVDIQDEACQGEKACIDAFQNAGSGSSIVIKEGGCVSERVCGYFAENADGVVTASIGKHSCSGGIGGDYACYYFLESALGNITVDIQDGACQGDEACRDAFNEAGSGSSIVIKERGCVGYDEACSYFAYDANEVVTASIGFGACSGGGEAPCSEFLGSASGNITVDIQDEACQGEAACYKAFNEAGSGSSIVIKERGCVGNETCYDFAKGADWALTASIGIDACSGGSEVCNEFGGEAGDNIVMIDIQDLACAGDKACSKVGYGAVNLNSLTVPRGECSAENACENCGESDESDGGLAVTTACCESNVDDACLYSDAPSNFPSSKPSYFPSSNPSESSKPSYFPSSNPSESSKPSYFPSSNPSESSKPSYFPSSNPSESSKPSYFQSSNPSESSKPSYFPSSNPSESSKPSDVPSENKNVKGGKANKAPKTEKASKAPKTEKASKAPKKSKAAKDVMVGDANDIGFTNTPNVDVVDIEITAEGNIRN